ncbi:MAG TPA: PAS domain S-box protein [Ktedonobacteraceae bacterium]|nr:PAS domain S-box protein [Ktedonobacteraceae bacterium]
MSDTGSDKHQHTSADFEDAWQESERRFQAVWESASDAMVLSAPDGTVIDANPAYFHLYGYSPGEVIGKNYAIIFPPEQRAWALELYAYVFQSPAISPSFVTPILRADGAVRIVDSHYTFLTRQGVRYAMLSIVRDITEQKRIEEALRESELKLHLALEVGHMVTWDWEIASNTLRWSANLETALELPSAKSGMTYQAFLELVDARDRAHIEHEVGRAFEVGDDLQVEFRVRRPDGSMLWARVHGEVLFNDENKPMRMIGIGIDITHSKQSEALEEQNHSSGK